jgi:short-subunit dehydrogenase involved in D-alanine esterification of teichoic acids
MGASKPGYMRQIIANAFIDQGNNVIISGRNNQRLEKFSEYNIAMSVPCDISSEIEIKNLAKQ